MEKSTQALGASSFSEADFKFLVEAVYESPNSNQPAERIHTLLILPFYFNHVPASDHDLTLIELEALLDLKKFEYYRNFGFNSLDEYIKTYRISERPAFRYLMTLFHN